MPETSKAKRYVMYLRRSSDDSRKQMRSIKDQKDACIRLLKEHNIKVQPGDIIEEERSARKSGNRPKFTKLLAEIRTGKIDGIVAWAPDRLARNMKEAGEIIDLLDEGYITDLKFAAYYFFNDYNGVMALGMAFVLAKQYTDKLAHDVRRGVRKALREGKSCGTHKPGYLRDERTGYYEPDETPCMNGLTTFELVRTAWEKRVDGETLEAISRYLNDNGYCRLIKRTGHRQRMTKQKLHKVFVDPFYYGVLVQAGDHINLMELDVGPYQPMIDEADFLRAQRMTRPELSVPNRHEYPFKGLLICGDCRKPLTAGAPRGRAGNRYLRYWCTRRTCPSASIRARDVIAQMGTALANLLIESEHYEEYKHSAKRALKDTRSRLITEQANLTKRKKRDEDFLEELIVLKSEDDRERAIIARKKDRVKKSLTTTERRMFEIDGELAALDSLTVEKFLNTLKTASERLEAGTAQQRDTIARKAFLNIIVQDGKVATVSLKEPFASMLKDSLVQNGGGVGSVFEHIPALDMATTYRELSQLDKRRGITKNKLHSPDTHYNQSVVY